MSRHTIAAGTLPNTPGYLGAWIADPQHLKPGNLMPILDLSGSQLADIEAYLETLK
jgi:cytochrome c oxidase subunit 2